MYAVVPSKVSAPSSVMAAIRRNPFSFFTAFTLIKLSVIL
jgi:hypothetical protein